MSALFSAFNIFEQKNQFTTRPKIFSSTHKEKTNKSPHGHMQQHYNTITTVYEMNAH